jgi:hypothetical protein
MFGAFVKNKVGVAVWIHIWVLYSVPLVFMSVFVPVSCCFYCYCFECILKSGIAIPPALLFLVSVALAICGLLCVQMNFRFFNLCDECHWDFEWNHINHVDCFW